MMLNIHVHNQSSRGNHESSILNRTPNSPVFLIGLAGGGVFFFEEFDFGNELPGTPQKAVGCAPPPPKNTSHIVGRTVPDVSGRGSRS